MRKFLKLAVIIPVLLGSLSCKFFSPVPQTAVPPSITPSLSVPSLTPAGPTPPALTLTPVGPTATAAPTGLNASGPYLLYQSEGIWISNPDGSFPTQLTALQSSYLDLRRAVSPGGDRLAMVVPGDNGPDLVQVAIPSGETKTLVHLYDITQSEIESNPTSARAFAAYALSKYDSFAWQPGSGRLLAFMGAMNGATSDLYTYDTQTGKIAQLTNGPSQAISPFWSPDGKYILHYGGSWVPPFGGAILGYTRLDGVWAVRVSDGQVISEPKPKGIPFHFVDWLDDTHYITYDSGIL